MFKDVPLTILQEIQKWSRGLPDWQQDAIRRLYDNRSLSAVDLEDLYAMAKAEQTIDDPFKRKPAKLLTATIAAPSVPNRVVQITSIRNLVNVNALAEDQTLQINPMGLTVIYGENGAGKSGYSRVLKKACRARDQSEAILQDARKPKGEAGVPQATFDVITDGVAEPLEWSGDAISPEQLSEIAIFDSHCARAYVDNQGDFAYVPYGLDILEGLVKACVAVKDMAKNELAGNKPNLEPFAVLAKTNTDVGRMLSGLSAETKPAEVEKLATVSAEESVRLTFLNKTIAESDPKQKAQVLRLCATRFTGLADRVNNAMKLIDDVKVKELQDLVEKSNSAKQAAELASELFRGTPGLLPGTGGEPWKDLFEAARQFAAISHTGSEFPNLPAASACPLCQNALGEEGVTKLIAFEKFIQQKAEKNAKTAKAAAATAYRAIDNAVLDLSIDEALTKELKHAFPDVFEAFTEFQKAIHDRRQAAMSAAAGKVTWESIAALPASPSSHLTERVALLLIEVKSLEDAMNVKAKAALVAEQAELDACSKLAALKGTALEAIAKLTLNSKLQTCVNEISTAAMSRKSTSLSENLATDNVVNALNKELRALSVHELQVVMKAKSPGGKTQYKLALQLPSGASPSAVLSEGEQRAIAIASFLAEVQLGEGRGGIVFDDPVSSLDHRRRSDVASRLVDEANQRQVVVFTHDIYFLCILQQEAKLARSLVTTQCIGRGPAGFGIQTDSLPFDVLTTKERVKVLRGLCAAVAKAHKSGDEAEATRLTREAYAQLRMAWERGVEEVLFQGTVARFAEGVSTSRLRDVVVEDSDYEAVTIGMTKCSKYSGHDAARIAQLPTPHFDNLLEDIENLEEWRASVEKRKAAVGARRK